MFGEVCTRVRMLGARIPALSALSILGKSQRLTWGDRNNEASVFQNYNDNLDVEHSLLAIMHS